MNKAILLFAIRHGIKLNPDYIKSAEWSVAEVLALVRERLDEASDEEADEIIERLESLLEEAGA
jgi:hypothetical protein